MKNHKLIKELYRLKDKIQPTHPIYLFCYQDSFDEWSVWGRKKGHEIGTIRMVIDSEGIVKLKYKNKHYTKKNIKIMKDCLQKWANKHTSQQLFEENT